MERAHSSARASCIVHRALNVELTAGLMFPTGLLPAARRASLIATIIAAKMGVDADVPPLIVRFPPTTSEVGNPFVETSGTPRPDLLKTFGPR